MRAGIAEKRLRGTFSAILVFLFLFFPCSSPSVQNAAKKYDQSAGPVLYVNQRIVKGIHLIYNRRFNSAEDLFGKMILDSPQDPCGHFYLTMITWARLAAGFWTEEMMDEFKRRIDRAIVVAQARMDGGGANSYDFFYLGGALGFKGRFELMKGNWFSSFLLASDAIKALKTCREMAPSNKDVLLGIGTFDYYTARLSGALKFLTYFLLHRGDRKEGIKKLYDAAAHATYASTEAKSILLHIQFFLEKNFPKALLLTSELSGRYDENPRFKLLEGVCFIQMDRRQDYERTVEELREKSREASPVTAGIWKRRALYLTATNDLINGNYEKARFILEKILADQDPVNDPAMIAWPLIKIGMSYDLAGKRDQAVDYYHRVFRMKNGSGAQFLAKKLLGKPIKPKNPFIGY
ncbi:conserved hypothetical protein [delta proteobacterium NaphS2]|nr:conserved hypothetical protein [delta proteobacterium NaphS2]